MLSNTVQRCLHRARLRLAHVGDAEHELERAVAARDARAVGDEHGARAVLGVRDAREDDAQCDCVQQLAPDYLRTGFSIGL